jgi:hypothetical protein
MIMPQPIDPHDDLPDLYLARNIHLQ